MRGTGLLRVENIIVQASWPLGPKVSVSGPNNWLLSCLQFACSVTGLAEAVVWFSERLSICLNLAEGSAKQTNKERRRFYYIALGSQREVHCLLELEGYTDLLQKSDHLGASLYKLTQSISA